MVLRLPQQSLLAASMMLGHLHLMFSVRYTDVSVVCYVGLKNSFEFIIFLDDSDLWLSDLLATKYFCWLGNGLNLRGRRLRRKKVFSSGAMQKLFSFYYLSLCGFNGVLIKNKHFLCRLIVFARTWVTPCFIEVNCPYSMHVIEIYRVQGGITKD